MSGFSETELSVISELRKLPTLPMLSIEAKRGRKNRPYEVVSIQRGGTIITRVTDLFSGDTKLIFGHLDAKRNVTRKSFTGFESVKDAVLKQHEELLQIVLKKYDSKKLEKLLMKVHAEIVYRKI